MNETTQNQQLTQSMQALTHALAASERRIHGMERLFRQLGAMVLILALIVLLPKADALMGRANAGLLEELGLVKQDMTHIRSILSNLDTLLTVGSQFAQTPQMTEATADLFTLLNRIKQDSDLLRIGLLQESLSSAQFTALKKDPVAYHNAINSTSPTQALFKLQKGIKKVQEGIQGEVHFLNGNIQSMVYSLDSTMGRVGRMMSPMPLPFGY